MIVPSSGTAFRRPDPPAFYVALPIPMETVTLNDKQFVRSIPETEVQQGVIKVAEELNRELAGKVPLFIVVLNGAFLFAADLVRQIKGPCEVSFVKLASYVGTTSSGKVHQLVGLNEKLDGREVVIVEDIVDSGLTLESIMAALQEHHPAGVTVATLLFKPASYTKDIPVHHRALEVPDDFLVGYGLDHEGLGRNLRDIYKLVE